MNKDMMLWSFAAMLLLVACGAAPVIDAQTPIPLVGATERAQITYHSIDNTTTTFAPDTHIPIICYYVESIKVAEHYDSFWKAAYSSEFTSGLSCIMVGQEQFDNYLERYPQ